MGIGNANNYESTVAQQRWANARARYPEHEYSTAWIDGEEWFIQRSTGQPAAPCPKAPQEKRLEDVVTFVEGPREVSALQNNGWQSGQRATLNNVRGVSAAEVSKLTPEWREYLRKRTNVTTDQLAATVGVPVGTIEAWESGQADPDPLMGAMYSKYLTASMEEATANGELK